MPFRRLVAAMAAVEDARVRAERTYKVLLERFPGNARLVRAYARFLADVRGDAPAAARQHREADRLERAEDALVAAAAEEQAGLDEAALQAKADAWDAADAEGAARAWAQRGGAGGDDDHPAAAALAALDGPGADDDAAAAAAKAAAAPPALPPFLRQVSDRAHGIVVINAFGTIQMVNRTALRAFGYKKGELDGKNVSVLMPQPFAARHNGFLRSTMTTGRTVFLNKVMPLVGLHRDRIIIPLRTGVVKVAGAGADALYVGVISVVRESR